MKKSLLELNNKTFENVQKLEEYKNQTTAIKLDILIESGSLIKPVDKKSEELLDALANLEAVELANKELQEQFKNGDTSIGFDEVFSLVEKLAKQEFTLKAKLIQLTKA